MRKKILISLATVILIQSNYCKAQVLVELDEFGIFFIPKRCTDTLSLITDKGEYKNFHITLYLYNCKGECRVKIHDKKNVLRAEGKYSSCLDTLKRYNISKIMGRSKAISCYQVRVLEYFRPLKIGKWIYYDKNGKIEYQAEYDYQFTRQQVQE